MTGAGDGIGHFQASIEALHNAGDPWPPTQTALTPLKWSWRSAAFYQARDPMK